MNFGVVLLITILVTAFYWWVKAFATVIIYDFQKGLLYKKGRFVKILGAGKYYYLKSDSAIQVIDIRKNWQHCLDRRF